MSTQPCLPPSWVPPRRPVASMGTTRRGVYYRIRIASTIPAYESLGNVVHILADASESPISWATAKLRDMTARNVNWEALGSDPPNFGAESHALTVLQKAHAIRPIEPAYVTASATGGVGIVYKSPGRYAAIECSNNGNIRLLWFDVDKVPKSRRIQNTKAAIARALEHIKKLHGHA